MKTADANIDGEQVRLRLLAEDDLALTLAWRNRDGVRRWFRQSAMIDIEAHRAWFREHQLGDDALMFIVEEVATGEAVGQVSIYSIDRETGEAEVGRFIAAPNASGKGYIRAAIIALTKFAFDALSLERVYLEVFASNERAIRLYASVGFIPFKSTDGCDDMMLMEMKKPS
ncbi:MAG: GNAT family N-acetyltransferase [Pseudomonadota bacterium]